ncbi:probable tRNA (uracil-O(2)-)-methyltransferase [Octopus bimaculoides]|uniref:tRNA (uracil-O(2)-)-methyltransferase n=1 Tax=Octopus bimaculoides TaxID=37653 RepID=A0A0L8HJA3_OCTBM|nr:probable tRNA (uracil-O(2)-)-methyltransferase [Octopus bimaculoides]|eukprot:XP_014771876.1 PREDICTED: probable tRNA (uracil-O(2)-)-methyltransferase [Octopus bimaculoides]
MCKNDINKTDQTKPTTKMTTPEWSHCPQCLQCPLRQASESTSAKSESGFVAAILVWLNKPHVVNRRLIGSRLIATFSYPRIKTREETRKFLDTVKNRFVHSTRWTGESSVQRGIEKRQDNVDFTNEEAVGIEHHTNENNVTWEKSKHFTEKDVTRGLNGHHSNDDNVEDHFTDVQIEDLITSPEDLVVFVRDLLPRNLDLHQILREVITYDQQHQEFHFYPIARFDKEGACLSVDNDMPYSFMFLASDSGNRIELKICKAIKDDPSLASMTYFWLEKRLLCKVARWSGAETLRTDTLSLRTVSVEAYNQLYNQLKAKYGPKLIEEWPERTDPKKFVYEDIAIATFLLLLWEKERQETKCEKQTFVDLGCGNGLLVHLLTSEGHSGLGIDIQKRKIWDMYGDATRLELRALTPSADSLFPEYDWIIGNHSDELTPWIPVIAARSKYNCRFFVLPCCLYNFDSKYNEKTTGLTSYRTYLNYVKKIITVCGFQVEEDVLRIPSTKQICLYGKTRTYSQSEESEVDKRITEFIENQCSKNKLLHNKSEDSNPMPADLMNMKDANTWSDNFKPRLTQKTSGMCKSVPWNIKIDVVNVVVEKILAADDSKFINLPDGRVWHKGGEIPLPKIAQLLNQDTLNYLKTENGGLQTLLRNFSHIFYVVSSTVRLRDYTQPWQQRRKVKQKNTARSYKTSLCWFHQNHPDGCPVSREECNFAHGEEELREKTHH